MATQQKSQPITSRIGICSASYIPFKSRRAPHAVIRLAGQWLQESGFCIGHVIEVACEDRKLTITIAAEQKYAELQALFQKEKIEIM